MSFWRYMGHKILGIFLLVFGICWFIVGMFKNGWLAILGFLMLIASGYFLKSKIKKKNLITSISYGKFKDHKFQKFYRRDILSRKHDLPGESN